MIKTYIVKDSTGRIVDYITENDRYNLIKYACTRDQYGGFYRLIPVDF